MRLSSRTTRLSRAVGSTEPQPASVAGVQCTCRPTPPTSTTTRPSGASAVHGPGDARDHVRHRHRAAREPGLRLRAAPDVADRQRQRVGRIGRLRRLASPSRRVTIGADLRLVGAARSGHRRLDLARRVQGDRQPGRAATSDGDGRRLRRAHDRADVVLAEHPLDGDGVRCGGRRATRQAGLERAAAARRCRASAGVRTTSTPTSRSLPPGAPRPRPTPHRVRPGSTPSTRRAPAGTGRGRRGWRTRVRP